MVKMKDVSKWVSQTFARDNLTTADGSSGMCYSVTQDVQYQFDFKNIIYSFHDNDALRRYRTLGQYSDHFAIMHRGKVLDYTLRQFDESTPWPFYGTIDEWKSVLEKAWETKVDHHIIYDVDDRYFIREEALS